MTRQSETAGFGPRPRWRRFHQGALALAVAAPLAGSALLVAAALAPASAQTRMVEIGENKVGGVRVTQGKSQTLQTTLGFVDLVVGDPEIADVMPLTDRSLSILGKKIGTTRVSVYGEGKKLVGVYRRRGRLRHVAARQRARAALPGCALPRLLGQRPHHALRHRARRRHGDERGGDREAVRRRTCINAVKVAQPQQVMLEVRFVEASRTPAASSASTGRSSARTSATATKGALELRRAARDRPRFSGAAPFGTVLGRMLGSGVQADVLIQALEERGSCAASPSRTWSRSRATPRASSPAASSRSRSPANLGTITVEYKRYGVGLAFTPTVLGDGVINLKIEPEVSQIDPTNRSAPAASRSRR